MTEADQLGMEQAVTCDRTDMNSLAAALEGLRSTRDPTLVALHNDLFHEFLVLRRLKAEAKLAPV